MAFWLNRRNKLCSGRHHKISAHGRFNRRSTCGVRPRHARLPESPPRFTDLWNVRNVTGFRRITNLPVASRTVMPRARPPVRGSTPGLSPPPRRRRRFCSSMPLVTMCSASMSTSQPVRRAVNRAFWPRLPMASDNCVFAHQNFHALAVSSSSMLSAAPVQAPL